MRIATYSFNQRKEVGILSDNGMFLVPFDIPVDKAETGLLAFLDSPHRLSMRQERHDLSSERLVLLAPIPRPRRNIICVGKNYREHVEEIADQGFDTTDVGKDAPKAPVVFSKFPECVIGTGSVIEYDSKAVGALDYEAELAVIIGKQGKGISTQNAMEHVWGYTIVNDVTARDLQRKHRQWLIGKSQDTFCPMGPLAITKDALDLSTTPIRCWVNSELRQDAHTGMMIFNVAELIEHISAGITLYPGDIIATGTPAGVGAGQKIPSFLRHGDKIRIEIPPIGFLENTVSRRDA
jgi:2-keto-4-pentenoate hydratase/2-oxohepta-3-ene-1,7-dioic acid hydratase in catechol pathway